MEYRAAIVDELIALIRKLNEPLRACQPRDIVNQIRWAARYERRQPVLDRDDVMAAVEAYFVADSQNGIPRAAPQACAD